MGLSVARCGIGVSIWWVAASVIQGASASHTSSAGLGTGLAPIGTETAVPLAKGQWSVGLGFEYVNLDPLSEQELHRLREADPDADLHSADSLLRLNVGIAYGVSDHLSVGLRLPYVRRNDNREPEFEGAGHVAAHRLRPQHEAEQGADGAQAVITDLGDSKGIGDLIAFGQYRFFESEDHDTHLAALFGVQAPTGKKDDRTKEGPKFEAELQPGSGAWNGIAGSLRPVSWALSRWMPMSSIH